MKRRVQLLLFICQILLCYAASGQGGFQSAKIILATGDTLKVLIPITSLDKVYNSIQYQEEGKTTKNSLRASQIRQITLSTSEEFYSRVVQFDNESQRLNELNSLKVSEKFIRDTVLVKAIIRGTLSLYELEARNGRLHFFIEKSGIIEELLYRKYFSSNLKISENRRFAEQLWIQTNDCPSVQKSIPKNLEYKKTSISKIVNAYNACKGDVVSVIKTEHKTASFHIGAVVEMFGEQRNHSPSGIKTSREWGPAFGLSFELGSKLAYKKISLYNEVRYSGFKTDFGVTKNGVPTTAYFDLKYFDFVNSFRWNYYLGKKKLFFNIGIKNAILLDDKWYLDPPSPNVNFDYETVGKWNVGGIFGIGISIIDPSKARLTAEIRYGMGIGSVTWNADNMNYNTIGIVLNYSL